MSDRLPTGWRGRLAALGLLMVMLTALYLLFVAPLLALYAKQAATLEARQAMAQKFDAVADALPTLRMRVAALRAAANGKNNTLEGATDAVASAGLQNRITELATSVGATISSSENLPAEGASGYQRLGIKLVLSGSYESLLKLLAKIDTTAPPLMVDNLVVQSLQHRPGGPPIAALDARLDVYGFRASRETSSAEQ